MGGPVTMMSDATGMRGTGTVLEKEKMGPDGMGYHFTFLRSMHARWCQVEVLPEIDKRTSNGLSVHLLPLFGGRCARAFPKAFPKGALNFPNILGAHLEWQAFRHEMQFISGVGFNPKDHLFLPKFPPDLMSTKISSRT